MKFCDYMSNWVENVKSATVAESTLINLRFFVNYVKRYPLGDMELDAIRTSHINAFLNAAARDGVTRGFLSNVRASIGNCFKSAIIDGDVTVNPVALSTMPAESKLKASKPVEAFTDDEQAKLAPFFHSDDVARKCEEFMLETGLRIGEALALNWEDVHPDDPIPYINVHTTLTRTTSGKKVRGASTKTKAGVRRIPISKRAAEILRSLPRKNEIVFRARNGKRLEARHVRHDLNNVCSMAGIPQRGPHALRHTFATNQFYKGTDIKVLSKLLGHANTNVTYNTYINLYGDAFDDMAKAVS